MTISLRLKESDAALIRKYAELTGKSVSELIRESVLSRIEDEYDLQAYEKAMAAYESDPQTYTLEQVEKELGLA